MSSPRIELVRELTALDERADAWDALAETSPPCRPTLTHAWVRAALRHRVASNDTWSCTFAWDGDELVGVLPIRRRGMHLHTLCDDHTPSGDAVLARTADASVLDALLHAHGAFRSATFAGIVPTSPSHAWLKGGPGGRPVLHSPAVMTGARIDVTKTFDDAVAGLSSNSRSKLRKGERLLADAGHLTFHATESPDAFQSFLDLEAAGWKGRQGTALKQDGAVRAFYEDLLGRLAFRGWLRIHRMELDGRAVAVELLMQFGTSWVVHKVTFDESHAKASPGNVMWAWTLDAACRDDRTEYVDLLAMDELMQRWGATPYAYDTFTVFARGLVPTLLARWPAQWRERLGRARPRRSTHKPDVD